MTSKHLKTEVKEPLPNSEIPTFVHDLNAALLSTQRWKAGRDTGDRKSLNSQLFCVMQFNSCEIKPNGHCQCHVRAEITAILLLSLIFYLLAIASVVKLSSASLSFMANMTLFKWHRIVVHALILCWHQPHPVFRPSYLLTMERTESYTLPSIAGIC